MWGYVIGAIVVILVVLFIAGMVQAAGRGEYIEDECLPKRK